MLPVVNSNRWPICDQITKTDFNTRCKHRLQVLDLRGKTVECPPSNFNHRKRLELRERLGVSLICLLCCRTMRPMS